MNLFEQFSIFGEEFLGYRFDAESLFDVGECGIGGGVLQKSQKTGLRGVATFALSDDIREASGRSEACFYADNARILGETPRVISGGNERYEGGILFITLLKVIGYKVANSRSSTFKF